MYLLQEIGSSEYDYVLISIEACTKRFISREQIEGIRGIINYKNNRVLPAIEHDTYLAFKRLGIYIKAVGSGVLIHTNGSTYTLDFADGVFYPIDTLMLGKDSIILEGVAVNPYKYAVSITKDGVTLENRKGWGKLPSTSVVPSINETVSQFLKRVILRE